MPELTRLRSKALAALAPLSAGMDDDTRARRIAIFRPSASDFERIFVPGRDEEARRAYSRLWELGPVFGPRRQGAGLKLHLARGGDLQAGNSRAWKLPQGYRDIAAAFLPRSVWVAWSYAQGGGSFDGLVWTGERFVWLPQPFRFLRPTPILDSGLAMAHWAH